MIKFEKIQVSGFEAAFRGMRNPKESWKASDSIFGLYTEQEARHIRAENVDIFYDDPSIWKDENIFLRKERGLVDLAMIGPEDLGLAQRLIKAGTDHSKFMRQIFVTMDITAPLYWWKEASTYKIGTVANSTSTMHKLASTEITEDCFSFDFLSEGEKMLGLDISIEDYQRIFVETCENLRKRYLDTKDPDTWRALIQLLPESWMQKRTWSANYAVLRNILFARENHKLIEWHTMCDKIRHLPYGKQLIALR